MSIVVTGVVVAGVGVGLEAYGMIKSGQAQEQNAQATAALGEQNATSEEEIGGRKLQLQQRNAAKTIDTAQAQYSANGIDISNGSALDVLHSSMAQAAEDSNQIQYETQAKAQSLRMGADSAIAYGESAANAQNLTAAGTLFSGLGGLGATLYKAGVFKSTPTPAGSAD